MFNYKRYYITIIYLKQLYDKQQDCLHFVAEHSGN